MDDSKKVLYKRINHRIDVRGYCVVYDHELAHIWPPEAALRQKQIELIQNFAAQNGLAVTVRDNGLYATFKKTRSDEAREPRCAKWPHLHEPIRNGSRRSGHAKLSSKINSGAAQEIGDPAGKGYLSYQPLPRLSDDSVTS